MAKKIAVLKMTKKNQKNVAAIIKEIGTLSRQRINELPAGHERDVAWACLASGIVGAALHDGDMRKTLELLQHTVVAIVGASIWEKNPS